MADEDLEDEEDAEDDDGEGGGGGGGGSKKLIIIIAIPLLLLIGGGAAAYFLGLLDPVVAMVTGEDPAADGEEGAEGAEGGAPMADQAVFFDLPELLVNLNSQGRRAVYLKMRISLEVETLAEQTQLESLTPRVVDSFQVYLRELRMDDLQGSAGMYRLEEELMTRVNAAVAPIKVKDVLFKEMLVQ
ncbi:flagellar basal body-associated FliL family protein [Magnetospira sp. QH-2]|uniref:flagellar basal body-associated FliL family protein n=1 Tax=Magnetospira sp. (strain QH-2) TaxID=1288970 RepID=UPI0003E80C3B|nr:flagellar basal body-associated FliL family protein [Magnetospira sp. QH-2]CCQ74123.1 Flagellar basal body-associated protein FliL [Magnetospira sp. QH-2]